MAQFIKLTDSLILNADSIDIVVENGANSVIIVLAETSYDETQDEFSPYYTLAAGTGKGANLLKAINKALTSNPGGRVIEVGPGDYTVGALVLTRGTIPA